ncbi:MAG TPA: hypothetical protein GX710_05590 [Clostridiales bacterium]|nr:hypothetical protein [Clostridiales bacterium]
MHRVEFTPKDNIYRTTRKGNVAEISECIDDFCVTVYDVIFVHGTLYCVDLPEDKILFIKRFPRTEEKNSLMDYALEIDTIIFEN